MLKKAQGFTLVEVMVVIVIITIVTSLVVLNIGSIDQRRAMQARDAFVLDLQRIGRESVDQAKVLALTTQNASDVAPFRYGVLDYQAQMIRKTDNTAPVNAQSLWKLNPEFQLRQLPDQVYFNIEALDDPVSRASSKRDNPLLSDQAPQLIWLGNGEVKPVRIQFYLAGQPIAAAINIDHLGKITDAE